MQPNLVFAFAEQSRACAALGSAFMADLMTLLPRVWRQDTRLAVLFAAWRGDLGPNAASLPLRLAAGLHALVLTGQARDLAAVYPPHTAELPELAGRIAAVPQSHDAFLCEWVGAAPQTNETGRAAVLLAAAAGLVQARIRDAITRAGEAATKDAPIAWLAMEADGLGQGAGVTLQTWPQGDKVSLGRAGFHGQWVEWRGF